MTEKFIRLKLRRSGWSATNYACVNRLLTAALIREPLIRTCWVSGSGRYTSNQDHHLQTKRMLDVLGLGYTEGNDSPRGGLTGQWIKLDSRAMRLLQGVRDEAEAKRQRLADKVAATEAKRKARIRQVYSGQPVDVLVQWWKSEAYHPAPEPVLKAKQELNLSWSQVRELCRAHA